MQIDVSTALLQYQYIAPLDKPQVVPAATAISQSAARSGGQFGPAVVLEISPEGRAAYEASIASDGSASGVAGVEGLKECQTCKNRKYVDVSNDPSVSFQTPTHISPDSAMSAVAAHEGEHVRNDQAKAAGEGRKVVSQSVSIHTSVCPECGRVYVSGGQTRIVTAPDDKQGMQDEQGREQYGKIDLFA